MFVSCCVVVVCGLLFDVRCVVPVVRCSFFVVRCAFFVVCCVCFFVLDVFARGMVVVCVVLVLADWRLCLVYCWLSFVVY